MISVIIPVYNCENLIVGCVNSLLKQSYRDFEVLLINDGSTDGSEDVCKALAEKHSFIKSFTKPNGGAASARNVGLDNASGDYIAFVDADDTVDVDFLKELYEAAEKNGADLVMCDYIKHTSGNSFPFSQPIRGGVYAADQIKDELFPCLIMFDNLEFPPTISNWVCLFRRSLLEKNTLRYPEVRLCEDSFFGSVALYNANCFVYLKGRCLYNYLYYPSSVSHANNPGKTAARWDSFLRLNKEYEAYFSDANYDFSMQIKYNMLYFALNQLAYINSHGLTLLEQRRAVKKICKENQVTSALRKIEYPQVPLKLKFYIFLIKHKMALLYCLFHR